MPRIIITTDPSPLPAGASVWLDEHVQPAHLSTDPAAAEFIERLAWAISDAEDADGERASPRVPATRRRGDGPATRSRSQVRVRA
jgi:hypothetical protein